MPYVSPQSLIVKVPLKRRIWLCYVCSFPHKNVRFNVSVNTQLIFYNSWGDNKTFDKLATLMLTGSTTHQITEIIMQCQPLRNAVKFLFLKNVQCQSNLCNRSPEKSSVLLTPPTKHKVLRQQ